MAVVRYHKYVGELWEDLSLEDLVGELSDFLLQSGFGYEPGEWDEDDLQSLHDAILEAQRRAKLESAHVVRYARPFTLTDTLLGLTGQARGLDLGRALNPDVLMGLRTPRMLYLAR